MEKSKKEINDELRGQINRATGTTTNESEVISEVTSDLSKLEMDITKEEMNNTDAK